MGQINIGVNNVAHNVKGVWIGVNGVARKVKNIYIGVGGVARLVWCAIANVYNLISSTTSSIVYNGTMALGNEHNSDNDLVETSNTYVISDDGKSWYITTDSNGNFNNCTYLSSSLISDYNTIDSFMLTDNYIFLARSSGNNLKLQVYNINNTYVAEADVDLSLMYSPSSYSATGDGMVIAPSIFTYDSSVYNINVCAIRNSIIDLHQNSVSKINTSTQNPAYLSVYCTMLTSTKGVIIEIDRLDKNIYARMFVREPNGTTITIKLTSNIHAYYYTSKLHVIRVDDNHCLIVYDSYYVYLKILDTAITVISQGTHSLNLIRSIRRIGKTNTFACISNSTSLTFIQCNESSASIGTTISTVNFNSSQTFSLGDNSLISFQPNNNLIARILKFS